MRFSLLLILSLLCISAQGVESKIMSWNESIEWLRSSERADGSGGGLALYIGRSDNRFIELVRSGEVDLKGIPLVILSAQEPVLNPMTNRKIPPVQLMRLYASTIQSNPAGSIIFLDSEGVPLPLLTVHHALHRNRPDRLNLMIGYAASGRSDQMSLEEYARIIGKSDLILAMATEIRTGELRDPGMLAMQHYARQLEPVASLVATAPDGKILHTGQNAGRIFVVTDRPSGPAFMAQIAEIWEKLTVHNDGVVTRPPITVIGPPEASWESLRLLGIEFQTASAPLAVIRQGATPRMLLSGGEEGVVVELSGYIPGDLLGSLLGVHVANLRPTNPDMPLGETDFRP